MGCFVSELGGCEFWGLVLSGLVSQKGIEAGGRGRRSGAGRSKGVLENFQIAPLVRFALGYCYLTGLWQKNSKSILFIINSNISLKKKV